MAITPEYAVAIGPTWQKGDDGEYVLPERTLGWDVLVWCKKNLLRPDGSVWEHTPEQARFVLWWYAIDETGRFLYRDGVFQRLKGHGKDPLAATIAAAEFVGPCRFSHWGDDGEPVTRDNPQAWVVVAGVSKDSTRTTMTIFPWLFQQHTMDEHRIDMGKEIIYAEHGARRIESVTSSPRALEGGRSTFTIAGETHHWLSSNEGHEMAAVIRRNAAKSPDGSSRTLAITNAYEPGEESVAQLTREAWESVQIGRSVDVGLLYDSLEAHPSVTLDPETLPAVLAVIRGDSEWLDIPRILQEIMDKRNPPSRSRRFWLNQIVATEDAWVSPQEWDALADRQTVEEGEEIALGFDGSLTDDHDSLMGCRISDGYTFALGVWDPEQYKGQAPRAEIDRAVRHAFEYFDVVAFFSDLHPWESYVDAWAQDFGEQLCAHATTKHAVAWDMRAQQKNFTLEGAERVHNEITEKTFRHDGDPRVRQHVHNARRRPNAWGVSFGKESRESRRKVDSLAALILARMARRAYIALPERKKRRKPNAASFF